MPSNSMHLCRDAVPTLPCAAEQLGGKWARGHKRDKDTVQKCKSERSSCAKVRGSAQGETGNRIVCWVASKVGARRCRDRG